MRCPYHGWTYSLDGELKGTPDFAGVCNFDRSTNGLVPVEIGVVGELGVRQGWPSAGRRSTTFSAQTLKGRLPSDDVGGLHWMERRIYSFDCNWKVFVDNYLDGGYHVPHLHKGLDSVLDYSTYTIENGERFCLQSSPMVASGAEAQTGAVRTGDRALYYWMYPNFMINWYEGAMDTNLVLPRGPDRTEVIFDFYFADVSEGARARNLESIAVSEQIQDEDVGDLRVRAARPALARLHGRAALGPARSRRAPLPPAAVRRSLVGIVLESNHPHARLPRNAIRSLRNREADRRRRHGRSL